MGPQNETDRPSDAYGTRRDLIDQRIIDALRVDGRLTFTELGRRLGVSTSTAKRRVESLQATGAIVRFAALTADQATTAPTEAVVEVFCRGNVPMPDLARLFADVPEVTSAVAVAGMADAVITVRTQNNEELGRLVEKIREAPFIDRTRTSIILGRLELDGPN